MLDLIAKKRFKPTDNVLFWHTGGTPALFAYEKELLTRQR
jgi:D-cysteine desulfhydrase